MRGGCSKVEEVHIMPMRIVPIATWLARVSEKEKEKKERK